MGTRASSQSTSRNRALTPYLHAPLVAALVVSCGSREPEGDGGVVEKLPNGTAAFLYDFRSEWASELRAFDEAARQSPRQDRRELRYLFAGAGVLRLTGASLAEHSLTFSTTIVTKYVEQFPELAMIPIVGGRGGEFLDSWSANDQQSLALAIAQTVAEVPAAQGVLIDIEPMSASHVPFYVALRQQLEDRELSLWLFAGDEDAALYEAANVVVLSGYDIGGTPVTPPAYASRLGSYVTRVVDTLAGAATKVMVAVPAAASAEEYETQSGSCSAGTGFTQEQWLEGALGALCPVRSAPGFVGLAIWGFYGDQLEVPSGSGCFRHPATISPENYAALAGFGGACADSPSP